MVSQLKCYSNIEGTEMKLCEEDNGYTSCFTKYLGFYMLIPGLNPRIKFLDGQVVGRGCSDKGSMYLYEDHCETFKSKEKANINIKFMEVNSAIL